MAHQERQRQRGLLIGLCLVLLLALGVFLLERGIISFKPASQTARVTQKIEKKISQTTSDSSASAPSSEPAAPPLVRPMTVDRQDNDDGHTELGRIIINQVGIDLPIIKGAGSTEASSYDKLFEACTDKRDQVLGVDNYILASHSSDNPQVGFSGLLQYQDHSLNHHRPLEISHLTLKMGDLITVYQHADQRYYTFKISSIDGDESADHRLVTDKMADSVGKP